MSTFIHVLIVAFIFMVTTAKAYRRSGYNSQGNRYTSRGSGSAKGGSYHYSNNDGSYYYQNADGSTYYKSAGGSYKYTAPEENYRDEL
jgi:hypothetical protein